MNPPKKPAGEPARGPARVARLAERELPPGKVFVASHSGSMIGALLSRGKARGVGFAGMVSVGVEADLMAGVA